MQQITSPDVRRRRCLQAGLAAFACAPMATRAAEPTGHGKTSLRLVQLLDMSAEQQELSRDYATGVRLAWATEAARKHPLARLSLQTLNTDGTLESIREALAALVPDPGVLGLVGCVGDRLAVQVQAELRQRDARLSLIAPWMADSRFEGDTNVACLFASRARQLQQGLSVMRNMGINELCVLYASSAEQQLYDPQVARMAQAQQLTLSRLTGSPTQPFGALAARLPARAAVILCLATSAELALLTQAMAARGDRRFVLGLGDVDAPSLLQLAPGKGVPVILTQVVPNPGRGGPPVVETYRKQLNQLFEEAPSTISLAGYLAGLYASALVSDAAGNLSRESLLAQVARRGPQDLGGWRVDFREDQRGSRFVTHTLLGSNGQLIG